MKTVLLVCATILGVLGSPAISNNRPDASHSKGSINAVEGSGRSNVYNTLKKTDDPVIVTFCTNADFFGECTDITIQDGCNLIPEEFNDVISSADTHDGCAIVYDDVCTGDYMVLSDTLGTGYVSDFDNFGFNDRITAVAGC